MIFENMKVSRTETEIQRKENKRHKKVTMKEKENKRKQQREGKGNIDRNKG